MSIDQYRHAPAKATNRDALVRKLSTNLLTAAGSKAGHENRRPQGTFTCLVGHIGILAMTYVDLIRKKKKSR
jgi:hypothetical protein